MEQSQNLFDLNIKQEQPVLKLIFTPREHKQQKQEQLAEQYMEILNQRIEQKINWEHQFLILTGSEYPLAISQVQQCESSHLNAQQVNNILNPEQENYLSISPNKILQVKTPEIISIPKIPKCYPLQLQQEIPQESKKCSCRKSQCLKMYCECFKSGKVCDGCGCCDCKNIDEHQERKKAIEEIMEKQPAKFEDGNNYRGCRCTKSQCAMNYCECYLNGLMCGKYCRCRSCKNGKKQRKLKRDEKNGNKKREPRKRFGIDI